MKFLSTLLILAATSSVNALLHPTIRARQAHIRHTLFDYCAYIDEDFALQGISCGHLDVCLCTLALPAFVKTNVATRKAIDDFGEPCVMTALQDMIKDAAAHQQCRFPEHAQPLCEPANPCNFQCQDGFAPIPAEKPAQCACDAPNTVCNGKCGSFPRGCSSQPPSPKQKSYPQCKSGEQVCGTAGGGWECVDTEADIESCGGCTIPGPFGIVSGVVGQVCNLIENQASTRCQAGVCVVDKCVPGWTPSDDGRSCTKIGLS